MPVRLLQGWVRVPVPRAARICSVSLPAVKLLRLCLLVLLAVLLPVRGAMAAAMPCANAGQGSHGMPHATVAHPAGHGHGAEARAAGAGHADQATLHAPAHHGSADHASAHHDAADHDAAPHDPGHQDRCSVCSACCASPSLPSTPLGIRAPTAWMSVPFPAFSAPAPSFQSGGPERPPRST